MAEQLVINPNTVARTYGDLVRDGVLEARPGKGVFVARRRPVYTRAERLRRITPSLDAFVAQGVYLGFTPEEMREMLETKLEAYEEGQRV
jgi:GntR family transcriptional regulator